MAPFIGAASERSILEIGMLEAGEISVRIQVTLTGDKF